MKKKKVGIIAGSVAAIAVCSSMIVGSTLALFTSEDKVNIAITSGKVEVTATVGNITAKHKKYDETKKEYIEADGLYGGGKAEIVDGVLTLENVVPGDKVAFNIVVENKSTVDVKYKTSIKCTEGEKLMSGLEFNVGGTDYSGLISFVSAWADWTGEAKTTIPVTVELPLEAGNEYKNLTCKIAYAVEAVQGNAHKDDESELIKTKVSTEPELVSALNYVATNGGTITLMDNVVMTEAVDTVVIGNAEIDLNDKSLTMAQNATFTVKDAAKLSVSGGALNMSNAVASNAAIYVEKESSVNFDRVTLNTNCYGIFPYGNAASVNIKNSNLTSTSAAAISTNAAIVDNYNVKINVEHSSLSGATGLLANVPCTVNISNCNIAASFQGVIARGGNMTIKDSKIENINTDGSLLTYFNGQNWKSGNEVNLAGLTIGNKSDNAYQYPTNVTLINTTIESKVYPTVYMYGNATEEIGATLTYNASESNIGEVVNGGGAVTINKTVAVNNTEEAQATLDAAKDNTTIRLAPGDYGTLYLSVSDFSNKIVTGWAGGDHGYKRVIKGLTIAGAPGVKVDNIFIESGLYATSHATLKAAHLMPPPRTAGGTAYMDAMIEIVNLTIKDIEFTGEKTAFLIQNQASVDGLTFDHCSMICKDASAATENKVKFLYWAGKITDKVAPDGTALLKDDGTALFTNYKKNITVNNCTIENAYQVMETRGTENLTITDNTFKNISSRDLLLTADETKGGLVEIDMYHGKVVISGNTSYGGTERFIRMTGLGNDCELIVKDNTVIDYKGADNDYIKITKSSTAETQPTVVIEDNTCTAADGREVYIANDFANN